MNKQNATLSLYHLLDPRVLADPYPLYHQLRAEDPVHWDPFLHAWIVTRYTDVVTVFQRFSANRTPTPAQLAAMGLEMLTPLAQVLVRQMLFLDPPAHGRIRGLGLQSLHAPSRRTAALAYPRDRGTFDRRRRAQGPHGCDCRPGLSPSRHRRG